MSLLEIQNLGIDIRVNGLTNRLLHEVSLQINSGETVALVGESGSGKSLTARAVLGLLPSHAKTHGSINLDGTQILGASKAALRQVRRTTAAMVFQDPRSSINPVRTRCAPDRTDDAGAGVQPGRT